MYKTVYGHTDKQMDRLMDRQSHLILCPLFRNVHLHTGIKFHQYLPSGYQVLQ